MKLALIAFLLGIILGAGGVTILGGLPLNLPGASGDAGTSSQASVAGQPDVKVTLSPALLAALIQESMSNSQSPIQLKNVQIETNRGQLTISGDVPTLGRDVRGSVVFQPYVANGNLAMRVSRAQFGPVPVPGNIAQIAQRPINERLAAATGDLPATITSVDVDHNGITVGAHVDTEQLTPMLQPPAATP